MCDTTPATVSNIVRDVSLLHDAAVAEKKVVGQKAEDPTPMKKNRAETPPPSVYRTTTAIGVGFRLIVFLDGIVDADDYIDTLKRFLLNKKRTNFSATNRVLMQDGARPHTARRTIAFLETRNVEVLPWAPYSPDWNCIENVWSIVKRRLVATCFDTKQKLMDATYEAWSSIEQETFDSLARTFERRLQRTIERNGDDCQL